MPHHKNKKLTIVIIFGVLAMLAVLYYALQYRNQNAFIQDVSTTSTEPSAQSEFSEGNFNNKSEPAGNTISEDRPTIAEHTGTEVVENDRPLVSSTGEITLHSPSNAQEIKDKITISGYSKLETVNYRLIDNKNGVVASGIIKVTKELFSIELDIDTNATKGRLDIYSIHSDGTEYSVIEVPLEFRQ